MRPLLVLGGSLLLLGITATARLAAAAGDLEARAARIAALRSDVEALNASVTLEKEELTADLRATAGQEAELEAGVRRQELRLERLLSDEQEALREIETAAQGADGDLEGVVRQAAADLRSEVEASLPFKRQERLDALDQLVAHLDAKSLPTEQVAARLWAFAEDERRLTRENAIGRQVATIDGEEVLVDVARLGMVAMYFRAPDGRVGQVRVGQVRVGQVTGSAAGWSWILSANETDSTQVHALFDALEKGIRTGWFELPAPLASVQGGVQ